MLSFPKLGFRNRVGRGINGVHGRVISPLSGISAFSPPCTDELVQWLKTAPAGKVLADSKGTGTARTPQSGRCYTFNGTSEHLDSVSTAFTGDFTFSAWLYVSTYARVLWGKDSTNSDYIYLASTTQLDVRGNGGTATNITHGHTFPTNEWFHLSVTRSGSTVTVWKDGVAGGTTGTNSDTFTAANFGRAVGLWFSGSAFDIRKYSRALSSDELLYIANSGKSGTAPALTSIHDWLKCDEQAGVTAYDSSGNANHGTINTSAVAQFHGTSPVFTQNIYSWQNQGGYSDGGGGVYVPRDESDTANDVLGNPLDYYGRAPLPAWVTDSHCLTFSGIGDYVTGGAVSGLTAKTIAMRVKLDDATTNYLWQIDAGKHARVFSGSVTVTGFTGATITGYIDGAAIAGVWPDTNWHTLVITSDIGFSVDALLLAKITGLGEMDGSVSDFRISATQWSADDAVAYHNETGEASSLSAELWWPLAEGSGTSVFDVSYGTGVERLGTITGTVATMWGATRQDLFHYNANNGFRLESTGRYVPAMHGGTTSAGGFALTNPAVAAWNYPESSVNFDPYSTPELAHVRGSRDINNLGLWPGDVQWGQEVSSIRLDNICTYEGALTGACLTSAYTTFDVDDEITAKMVLAYKFSQGDLAYNGDNVQWELQPTLGSYVAVDGNAGEINFAGSLVSGSVSGYLFHVNDEDTVTSEAGLGNAEITSDANFTKEKLKAVVFFYEVTTPATSFGQNETLFKFTSTGADWTCYYDVSDDKIKLTDGTVTLVDSTALTPGSGVVVCLDFANPTKGFVNLHVFPYGGAVTGLRSQNSSSWNMGTQQLDNFQFMHTTQSDPSYPHVHDMDELYFFSGDRRLSMNAIMHFCRGNWIS